MADNKMDNNETDTGEHETDMRLGEPRVLLSKQRETSLGEHQTR
jgi:hypothetical protein